MAKKNWLVLAALVLLLGACDGGFNENGQHHGQFTVSTSSTVNLDTLLTLKEKGGLVVRTNSIWEEHFSGKMGIVQDETLIIRWSDLKTWDYDDFLLKSMRVLSDEPEIPLGVIANLLLFQIDGRPEGLLRTNRGIGVTAPIEPPMNLFYVRDVTTGATRSVTLTWIGNGWSLDAGEITGGRRHPNDRVFYQVHKSPSS